MVLDIQIPNIELPTPEFDGNIFSLSSISMILLIVALIFFIKYSSKKIVDLIFGILGILFLFQVLYIVGNTPIDQYIHISKVFKYDIFSSIAQFFPGTKFAQYLSTAGHWLSQFMVDLVNWIFNFGYLSI